MNNESIKEILDSLKFVIDNPTLEDEVGDEQVTIINYTELNAEESKQLLDYITNLQEENMKLFTQLEDRAFEQLKTKINMQKEEIERLNNIINGLEKYLDEALGQDMMRYDFYIILKELEELKEGNK